MTWASRRAASLIIKGICFLFIAAILVAFTLLYEWMYSVDDYFSEVSDDAVILDRSAELPKSEDTSCELIETYIIKLEAILAAHSWETSEERDEELKALSAEYGPKLRSLGQSDAVDAVMSYSWAIIQLNTLSEELKHQPQSEGRPNPKLQFQSDPHQLALLKQIAIKERERALKECQ